MHFVCNIERFIEEKERFDEHQQEEKRNNISRKKKTVKITDSMQRTTFSDRRREIEKPLISSPSVKTPGSLSILCSTLQASSIEISNTPSNGEITSTI